MRLEELANNNFIKGTDSVERYLLDIIKQYFSSNDIDDDSKEYIIKKAVEQMKQELNIDNAGVVSINGKTGEIEITLEELGGEPLITPKLSAFNVNFGSEENTACMGNDPRLSDKRHPLSHTHEMDEVNGLNGEISSIKNTISLLDNKTHKHDNLKALNVITYSGDSTEIDLFMLEGLENKTDKKITEINEIISNTQTQLNELMTTLNGEFTQYQDDFNNIKTYVDEKNLQLETDLKTYCDTEIQNKTDEINTEINNKINKTQLNTIINALNQQFSVLYETSIIDFIEDDTDSIIISETILPTEVTDALSTLNEKDYKIDFYIKYTDPETNKNITTNLPFINIENTQLICNINGSLMDSSKIAITSIKNEEATWPTFLETASIKVKINIKNTLEEV